MKRLRVISILSICLIATVLVTLGSAAQRDRDRSCQVEICHLKASGEYVTIWVGEPVLAEHLAHGDYLGACVVP